MMSNREDIYSMLQEARKEFLAAIDGLTPQQMTTPLHDDWSVKDILTHIVSWEELVMPDFRRVARGHLPLLAGFKESEVDKWNAMLMSLRRSFPLDQVMYELEASRKAVIVVLDSLPDERLAPFVRIWANVAARHERDHAQVIRQWREKEGI
jgi:hypothetical protein